MDPNVCRLTRRRRRLIINHKRLNQGHVSHLQTMFHATSSVNHGLSLSFIAGTTIDARRPPKLCPRRQQHSFENVQLNIQPYTPIIMHNGRCNLLASEISSDLNNALAKIEELLNSHDSTLKDIPNMPYPDYIVINESVNMLIEQELAYEPDTMQELHDSLRATMTDEQQGVYNEIISAVEKFQGGVFFLYGYGGTGKTFVYKILSSAIRAKGEIVLNVASSGMVALLLEGCRTTHSRFQIPINPNEDTFCSITPDSHATGLLKKTRLIIRDEAPMTHRHCFEALDRTLRVIMSTSSSSGDKPFGGKVIVFGSDFRQVLPVI